MTAAELDPSKIIRWGDYALDGILFHIVDRETLEVVLREDDYYGLENCTQREWESAAMDERLSSSHSALNIMAANDVITTRERELLFNRAVSDIIRDSKTLYQAPLKELDQYAATHNTVLPQLRLV